MAALLPTLKANDWVIRALAGNDLGLPSHLWNETVSATAGAGNTFEDSAINGTTARDRVIGIYGVYVASEQDSIATIRFIVGGKRTHQWDLQPVMADQPGSFSREQRTLVLFTWDGGEADPVIIPSNTLVTVQHYVRGGTRVGIQPSELVFLGVVLEPVGGGGASLQPLTQADIRKGGP